MSEGDLILTLLTKEHGKIDCIAKSARRLKSRFMGRLELFNRINVELFSGRSLENINEAEVLSVEDSWGGKLKNCAVAFFITEITHRLLQPGQQIAGVYHLLKSALFLLGKHRNAESVMVSYLIRLIGLLGFMPSWRRCALCGERIDLKEPVFLIHEDLAVSCSRCDTGATGAPPILKIVHYFQTHTLEEACRLNIAKEKEVLWQWIKGVLRGLLPREVRSERFAEKVLWSG